MHATAVLQVLLRHGLVACAALLNCAKCYCSCKAKYGYQQASLLHCADPTSRGLNIQRIAREIQQAN